MTYVLFRTMLLYRGSAEAYFLALRSPVPLPTAAMLRAARALLGWDQTRFGILGGVGQRTVARLEAEDQIEPDARRRRTVMRIKESLESDFGIEFIFDDGAFGEGVRFRQSSRPTEHLPNHTEA